MSFPVIKGASYVLVHVPHLVMVAGTTQTMEREANTDSPYLKKALEHLRSYDEVVAYAPNQAYIGNMLPDELANIPRPWFKNPVQNASRFGKYGEIFPQDEFYALMKISDTFDLVVLEKEFTAKIREKLSKHPCFGEKDLARLKEGSDISEIEKLINQQGAEELLHEGKLVGCVRRAHEKDVTLSSHVILENIACKASGVLALRHLLKIYNISPEEIDYIIECSEEACGDMNQRGGGNFAKAIGEIVGLANATGSDTRGFCAGPSHALINAAALVQAGVYKNVVVVAGGATAKLGMNGRDHVNKEMPILEDVLGGFAILVSENDGVNPIIRTDFIGRHLIGTGSSPQAVMQSIVADPLDRVGMKITDIDKFSVEMQNPEITEPAGAGDVPKANYKMIAALAVKRGELQKADMETFIEKHGMPGFAPTQGHVPSGVPFIGPARDMILEGKINNAMIIGKGSLFLARMTNLFDGVSFVMEKNRGIEKKKEGISEEEIKSIIAESLREFASYLMGKIQK